MFIGHYAPAFIAAAHPRAPKLGTLFVAAQLVDIGFFTLVLLDVEHLRLSPGISAMNPFDFYDMPYTHSLLGGLLWALLFGGLLWAFSRDRVTALIGGAVVLSHWFVDLPVHVPDLTLFGAPPKLGFGLWNHPAVAMPLELALTYGAFIFYLLRTRAVRPSARLAAGLLALVLLTVQVVNWFGAEPATIDASIPLTALAAYAALALLASWVGLTRRNIVAEREAALQKLQS
jgi:hypothetical protein